ncbi:isoleucine--tRNA ligase [Paenibacillus tepidiphilus]|uniref:isoleucine--tRNA ligase n=1 Tax=Paenibacillus tepidiphilus TaxID=2608683 RepID=UPI00123A753E|nr:isoleucine--tRNA ligase [Paenibacillus tepidiphilus]
MQKVDVREKARDRDVRVLKKWNEEDTFRKSMENRAGKPNYVFYEGPPTANGAPHIGHVLGRVIKDFIGRYQTMRGFRVVRKAGWDTHGLPVELGVQKKLGLAGKQEIESYGVEKFIKECKASVFGYEKQWREFTEAIGYWTDLDNPYVTLDNTYIESVWNILATVHEQGLMYRGHRVSPYCPSCMTTLSSHEVAQGYKTVKDLSATAKFKLEGSGDYVLAWTTTPWTLPAHMALAMNPEMEYVRAQQEDGVYILAKNLVDEVLKGEYTILSTHKGSDFIGQSYTPPFSYIKAEKHNVIVGASFVTDSSGTGIVHMAPAHGEDDYKSCRENGISFVSVVDASGKYTDTVKDFAGRFVKDCDLDIVKLLSEQGLLYHKEKYEHSYPFCWRCDTPLLYYATDSWFINTTAIKDKLVANNSSVDWYPEHVREGRFGKFLDELVDWNISRNRYWGTPLNVWVCEATGKEFAPHSIAELRAMAAQEVPEDIELHKPYVDNIKLKSPFQEGALMVRTPEVIDVWFDSGSMPFAQSHYPFENEEALSDQFPADMICEGIDQTRGWFYSLLAVSTLFKGVAPYKAVIATGHILDENGQKMSKSKGNVIDPWDIMNEYGTDAFRWAILSDSAPWNNKRFSRGLVGESKSKVVDTLVNTHAFLTLYAGIDGYDPVDHPFKVSEHKLDRWILSRLNSLILVVEKTLAVNDFVNASKAIENFVDELSNWYIRRSRDRFWGSGLGEEKLDAYRTLTHVLLVTSKLLAPFMPMLCEDIYTNLGGGESVHLADYPQADQSLIDLELERDMESARGIVELARNVRNETGIKNRQPLSELIVSIDRSFNLAEYEEIIKDEINVKHINVENSDSGFVDFTLKLNLKVAGKKYGKNVGFLQGFLKGMDSEATRKVVQDGQVAVVSPDGEELQITSEELLIEKQAKPGFAAASGYGLTVALNTEITPELEQEGWVREIVRAVQDYRKRLDLPIDKRVALTLQVDEELKAAATAFEHVLRENVLVTTIEFDGELDFETVDAGGKSIGIHIGA